MKITNWEDYESLEEELATKESRSKTHSKKKKKGYEKNEEDPDILNPIPFELEAIEMARKYVKQYSFRQVANWVTQKTGREISHVGLRKRLMHEQQRKNKARTLRKWSEYAQKAIEKAKAIEEERTGAKV